MPCVDTKAGLRFLPGIQHRDTVAELAGFVIVALGVDTIVRPVFQFAAIARGKVMLLCPRRRLHQGALCIFGAPRDDVDDAIDGVRSP